MTLPSFNTSKPLTINMGKSTPVNGPEKCPRCGFSHGSTPCLVLTSKRDVRLALDDIKPGQQQLKEELLHKLRELA